jgi:hypothetical protein
VKTLTWTSPWGTFQIDQANLAHSLRVLGDRVAKQETQIGQTPVVVGELAASHQHEILRYVHQTDAYLSALLLIDAVSTAFWLTATSAFLAGYNAVVSQRQ